MRFEGKCDLIAAKTPEFSRHPVVRKHRYSFRPNIWNAVRTRGVLYRKVKNGRSEGGISAVSATIFTSLAKSFPA